MLSWDETKRASNLRKHGLDFLDAVLVLDSVWRMDIQTERKGEARIQSFAYAFEVLTVLTVVYLPGDSWRIISFRRANRMEREIYYGRLEAGHGDEP